MTDFAALAACIRSGQIPEHHVPQLMRDDPQFAKWYKENAKWPNQHH
jgi:hypothetical protein